MKRLIFLFIAPLAFVLAAPELLAADAPPAAATSSADVAAADKDIATKAAIGDAALKAVDREVHPPGLLEHLVDAILQLFDIRTSGNTVTHYVIAAVLLLGGLLLRRIVTTTLFAQLRRLASKTSTTLDDKMFPALEAPVGAFVMLIGIFGALSVLKLSPESDRYIGYASRFAFSVTIFWGVWRAFGALLDHAHEIALRRGAGIAAFMPWIKKTLMVIFAIIGVLTVIQSLGYGENVKTVVAGLGIGGLAFALAAQDTLANVFGSIVVAIDQPFKIGEFVQIGANAGAVEDIGLRSTKLRRADKSLIVVPNKTVAAEPITNLSRFIRRRVEQVMNLTYDTTPEQMEAIVAEFRRILQAEREVDPNSVMVFFRDLSASSLDIWVVYETPDPEFKKHMATRQRMNLAMMRAVYAHGLSFAYPTQTLHFGGEIADKLADKGRAPA